MLRGLCTAVLSSSYFMSSSHPLGSVGRSETSRIHSRNASTCVGGTGTFCAPSNAPSFSSARYSSHSRAASCWSENGFKPKAQESVGVAGSPPPKYGWAPNLQSSCPLLFASSRVGSEGNPTNIASSPSAKRAAVCSGGTPRGDKPSENRLLYHSNARTHASLVTSGSRRSGPVSPEPPPRDSGRGCSW